MEPQARARGGTAARDSARDRRARGAGRSGGIPPHSPRHATAGRCCSAGRAPTAPGRGAAGGAPVAGRGRGAAGRWGGPTASFRPRLLDQPLVARIGPGRVVLTRRTVVTY